MAANKYTAMSVSDQTKLIKSARTRGAKLKTDCIRLANGFLLHYVAHGDMSNAMEIADMIGEVYTKGARKAFIDWCQFFSTTMRWDEKEKALVHLKGHERATRKYLGAEHHEVSFFDLIVEKVTPVNLASRMDMLIKATIKGLNEGTAEGYTSKDVKSLVEFASKHGWIDSTKVPEIPNGKAKSAVDVTN